MGGREKPQREEPSSLLVMWMLGHRLLWSTVSWEEFGVLGEKGALFTAGVNMSNTHYGWQSLGDPALLPLLSVKQDRTRQWVLAPLRWFRKSQQLKKPFIGSHCMSPGLFSAPQRGEERQEGHTGSHHRAGRISWLIGTAKTQSFGVFLAIPTALWGFWGVWWSHLWGKKRKMQGERETEGNKHLFAWSKLGWGRRWNSEI